MSTSSNSARERVIGIDPGSIRCGVGIVERERGRLVHIWSETIECGRGDFPERLDTIYERIHHLCELYQPTRAGIEGIFHYRNADSALKLGHARGVAMLALRHAKLDIQEYQPGEVKKTVGSYGAAAKEQVRAMVMRLLALDEPPGLDASDALAIAITAAWRRELVTASSARPSTLQEAVARQGGQRTNSGFQQRVNEAIARAEARRLR